MVIRTILMTIPGIFAIAIGSTVDMNGSARFIAIGLMGVTIIFAIFAVIAGIKRTEEENER